MNLLNCFYFSHIFMELYNLLQEVSKIKSVLFYAPCFLTFYDFIISVFQWGKISNYLPSLFFEEISICHRIIFIYKLSTNLYKNTVFLSSDRVVKYSFPLHTFPSILCFSIRIFSFSSCEISLPLSSVFTSNSSGIGSVSAIISLSLFHSIFSLTSSRVGKTISSTGNKTSSCFLFSASSFSCSSLSFLFSSSNSFLS